MSPLERETTCGGGSVKRCAGSSGADGINSGISVATREYHNHHRELCSPRVALQIVLARHHAVMRACASGKT